MALKKQPNRHVILQESGVLRVKAEEIIIVSSVF